MASRTKVPAARREKNAVATRAAILDAARVRFAANGYEHTGLRDIAGDAGIDAALICRYFGGKQELLAEILAAQPDCAAIFAGPRREIGAGLAARILQERVAGAVPTDLLIILRAASSAEAAPLLKTAIEEKFLVPLQRRLNGDARCERAILAASFVLGTMVMRSLLRSSHKRTSRSDRAVTRRLAYAIQMVIDGESEAALEGK
jgi:AcrR family transcriptional regulator